MTTPLGEIFEVYYGHSLELNRLKHLKLSEGGIPFVSRKMGDNGISAFVAKIDDLEPAPAGELTCALSGNGVLSTFLQEKPFYTAFHVARLKPKIELTKQQLLYYCVCIKRNRYRYSYGRQANRTLRELLIPEIKELPDWLNSSDVGLFEGSNKAQSSLKPQPLLAREWRLFKIDELFDLRKGKRLTKAQIEQRRGNIPFIGAIDSNNGVTTSVDTAIHSGGTITVNYNGAGVADAFYQPIPFWASDDVNVLYPKFEMSAPVALFIASVIRKEKYRFSYGRKWHLERMKNSEIHLPIDTSGAPDIHYMENFINSLPFSSQI